MVVIKVVKVVKLTGCEEDEVMVFGWKVKKLRDGLIW